MAWESRFAHERAVVMHMGERWVGAWEGSRQVHGRAAIVRMVDQQFSACKGSSWEAH